MKSLDEIFTACGALHRHLCPRQVLGARMGLLAGQLLRLDLPQQDKRLFTVVETDGCFTDGVAVATGCWAGRRTLRVEDFGKVAATFVDTVTGQSVRIAPSCETRALAWQYAPEARNKWEAYLAGYQRMPDDLLLAWQWVELNVSIETIVGLAGHLAVCQACHEEIINQREIVRDGSILCRACAGRVYYTVAPAEPTTFDCEWFEDYKVVECNLA